MSRKAWYWTLGGLAALLVVLLAWLTLPDDAPTQAPAAPSHTDHGAMDHGQGAPAPEDGDPLGKYLAEQDAIMGDMMAEMDAVTPSGNAAADFLAGMLPHHRAAVGMAESYLENGGAHETLAPLARDIIDAQTAEIAEMEGLLEDLRTSGVADADKSDAYWGAYHAHMDHHSMAPSSAASLDAAFAEGMLLHHQMAVDMANAILPNTENEAVLELARNMADAQTREIEQMRGVLEGLGE